MMKSSGSTHRVSPKNFIFDLSLSLVAFSLPVVTLYFFVQPGMARLYSISFADGAVRFGDALATVAIVQFLDTSFIGALSNLRLLRSGAENDKAEHDGGFIFLLLAVLTSMAGILAGCYLLLFSKCVTDFFLTLSVMILMSLFDLLVVEFRISLNYFQIVIANLFLIVGFGLGFLLFAQTALWQVVYIIGYGVGGIYVAFKTKFLSMLSGFKKPNVAVVKQYLKLSVSNIMTSVVSYGDRIVLYPLMGGQSVSIYTSASVACKAVSFISNPLNSVLLSYLVKIPNPSLRKKRYFKVLILLIVLLGLTWVLFVPLSGFMSVILYPQWSSQSRGYIPLIVLSVTLLSYGGVLNTVVLRIASASFQVHISLVRLFLYLIGSVLLTSEFGLLGFCLASLLAELVRMLMILFLLYQSMCCKKKVSN